MSTATIADSVLRDVLHSDVMAPHLGTSATRNAAKWRFLATALSILEDRGLLSAPAVVEPTTSAPLDPSKVKAGDTVTVVVSDDDEDIPSVTATGGVYERFPGDLAVGPFLLSRPNVVLTDHQPAPKPEWKPGTVAEATVCDHPGHRVMRIDQDPEAPTGLLWADALGHRLAEGVVTDVRPLAVIDPLGIDVDELLGDSLDILKRDNPHVPTMRSLLIAALSELGIEVAR